MLSQKKERLWTKIFIAIFVSALFISIASQMISNNISLYVYYLGGSSTLSGFLMGVYTFAAMISRLVSGYFLDHKGRFFILVVGCILFSFASIACILFASLTILPFLRFVQGFSYAVASTATATSVIDVVPRQRIAEGIGYYGLASALAMAIGPSFGLSLVRNNEFTLMFLSAAIIILISGIIVIKNHKCFSSRDTKTEKVLIKHSFRDRVSIWNLIEKKALLASIAQMVASMGSCSIFVFLALFAKTKGIEEAGLFFIIAAVSMMIARLTAGRFIDKNSALFIILPALLLSLIAYMILAFIDNSVLFFMIAGAMFGYSTGMSTPAFNSEAVRNVATNRLGAASATYLLSVDIGFGIGSVLWGIIIDHFGFRVMYCFSAICPLFCMLISFVFLHNKFEILKKKNSIETYKNDDLLIKDKPSK